MTDLKNILSELPPIFGRKAVERLMPGIISSKTLANLHSMGKGPRSSRIGRTVCYARSEFVEWLLQSSRSIGIDD